MARPSEVTAEQISKIVARIEAGESENSACKSEKISRSTFRCAALRHGVGDNYARALEALACDQVEKLEKAIEDMRSGEIDHQVARVEIDARKWFASKFLPARFGDKVALTGPDGGAVQFERIERRIIDPKVSEKPGLSRPSEAKSPNTVE